MNPPLYEAVATASENGREGQASTDDGRLSVGLSIPEDVGGPGGPGTNPEHLFAAGYAACFTSATRLVARRGRLDASGISGTARVRLHRREDDAGYELSAQLDVSLPALDKVPAEDLLREAHRVCAYSNATRGNIEVELRVVNSPG